MKPRTVKSMELYDILLRRGYPEPFCDAKAADAVSYLPFDISP